MKKDKLGCVIDLYFLGLIIIAGWEYPVILMLILIAMFAQFMFKCKNFDLKLNIILLTMAFTVMEIFIVISGAWSYSNVYFIGIPCWLPFAWALTLIRLKSLHDSCK